MFAFGKRKGPTLGLDINGDSIVAVQLERAKAGIELTRYANLPTPPNTVREGLVADPDTVGAVVREVVELAGIPRSGPPAVINVVVPGQSVVIRLMPVPTGMPQDELAEVVAQEAINHVPFPMREANLDWSVMPATERTDADGVRRVDVILAAIQKTIVDTYWRTADAAGVGIGKIDISPLVTLRTLSFAGYLNRPDQLTMVVHVRHDATDIVLVRNGMPLFTRSVLLGVETLAEAVSRSLDIHLDESLGMLNQIPLFGMAVPEPRLGQAAQIARTVFGDITDEVGRSLEFYRSQVGDVTVSEILLCGAGCVVPQVDQFLANRLNIETVVVDPLRDVLFDSTLVHQEKRSSYTTAMGSVVEETWLPVATVDLDLNKEGPSAAIVEGAEAHRTVPILPEAETPWFKPVLAVGLAVMVVVGLLWAYLTQFEAPRKQNELTRLETEIQDGNIQLKNLSKVKEENQVLLEKKRLLDSIVNEGHPWAAVLEVVRRATPPGVQLKKVVLASNKLTVDGLAVDFTRVSHMAINLSGSPLIDESTVNLAKRQVSTDPRIIEFSLGAHIRPEGEAVSPVASRAQVLEFCADSSPLCKQMAPIIEEAKRKYGDRVEFVTVNSDDPSNRPLMDKYQVKSIPNLCFLDAKGNLIEQLIGFEGEAPIRSALERVATIAQNGSTR